MKPCPVFLANFFFLDFHCCCFFMAAHFLSRFYRFSIKVYDFFPLSCAFQPFPTTHFVLHGKKAKQNATLFFCIGKPFRQHSVDYYCKFYSIVLHFIGQMIFF